MEQGQGLVPWRDLARVYRRLEARGEIRGGRFVAGMSGEQFAWPEAVGQLRTIRKAAPSGALVGISAADPLNLAGYVTTGDVIPALARAVEQALVRRRIPDTLKTRLHAMGALARM